MTEIDRLRAEVEADYLRLTSGSAEFHERALTSMPAGDTRQGVWFRPHPLYLRGGEGAWAMDVDGNRYLDIVNNMSAMILGHAHPAVVEAVEQQLRRGSAFAAFNEHAVELAELICERVPSIETVRFCNSGTEATMLAVRAARAFTSRPKLVVMEGGYHGSHDEFMGLNGNGHGYIPGVTQSTIQVAFNDLDAVDHAFRQHGDQIAALIVEPVFSGGGQLPPEPGYLERLRQLTRASDALLIFDEVVTFRLGPGGAQRRFGVTPDLTALGKVIGGGFPIGAFGGRADVMQVFSPDRDDALPHHGTYNGNPISTAGGAAALRCLDAHAYERLDAIGERFRDDVASIARESGVSITATGIGSLYALSFGEPVTRARAGDGDAAALAALLHLKLLTLGVMANARVCAFSTVTCEHDLDHLAGALRDAVMWLRPALTREALGV